MPNKLLYRVGFLMMAGLAMTLAACGGGDDDAPPIAREDQRDEIHVTHAALEVTRRRLREQRLSFAAASDRRHRDATAGRTTGVGLEVRKQPAHGIALLDEFDPLVDPEPRGEDRLKVGQGLKDVAEWVEKRGGGLLMLGGPRSFSEGGYAGTALGETLPVTLERMTPPAEPVVTRLTVRPTRAGAGHAVSQIAATDQASATRWTELPELTSVNAVDTVKAGATTLLSSADGARRERPVLAFQRYGRPTDPRTGEPMNTTPLPGTAELAVATVEDLVAKGAVRKGAPVKVLGDGDVSVKLTVSVQKVSATAAEKILAAGGTITQD